MADYEMILKLPPNQYGVSDVLVQDVYTVYDRNILIQIIRRVPREHEDYVLNLQQIETLLEQYPCYVKYIVPHIGHWFMGTFLGNDKLVFTFRRKYD